MHVTHAVKHAQYGVTQYPNGPREVIPKRRAPKGLFSPIIQTRFGGFFISGDRYA